jgi:hypothetical protein
MKRTVKAAILAASLFSVTSVFAGPPGGPGDGIDIFVDGHINGTQDGSNNLNELLVGFVDSKFEGNAKIMVKGGTNINQKGQNNQNHTKIGVICDCAEDKKPGGPKP